MGQSAFGQTVQEQFAADLVVKERNIRRENVILETASPSTNTSVTTVASPFTQIALTAKSGDQEASATVGKQWNNLTASAVLKQPFKEKPSRVTPLTLDGLNQGTSAIFNFQYSTLSIASGLEQRLRAGDTSIYAAFDSIRFDYAKRNRLLSDNTITDKTKLTEPDRKILDEIPYSSLKYVGSTLNRKELERLTKVKLLAPNCLIGGSASFGKVAYDYISDVAAVRPDKLTGLNRNIRLYVGHAFNENTVLAASYTWQRKYQTAEDDPISFSYPLGAGTMTTKEVYVGKPEQATTSRISLELRRIVNARPTNGAAAPDGATPLLALLPSVNVLTNTQKLALNLAVYFLQVEDSKQKGLQGGVAIGYITGRQFEFQDFGTGFSGEVFIAAPLNIFDLSK
jgi:hypothetical protein